MPNEEEASMVEAMLAREDAWDASRAAKPSWNVGKDAGKTGVRDSTPTGQIPVVQGYTGTGSIQRLPQKGPAGLPGMPAERPSPAGMWARTPARQVCQSTHLQSLIRRAAFSP